MNALVAEYRDNPGTTNYIYTELMLIMADLDLVFSYLSIYFFRK
jgi:hypothetical protein